MDPVFLILSLMTLAGAVAAMSLRSLVHCALSLAVSFIGIALLFLKLGAQFVGLAQILVYVGAVAILVVFAILLTRNAGTPGHGTWSGSWAAGLVIGVAVFATLAVCILNADLPGDAVASAADVADSIAVRRIGEGLMTEFVLPFLTIALLLTAALIGAVIIAMEEKRR
jgi:NADH-quinone oxidoreductase subunit J